MERVKPVRVEPHLAAAGLGIALLVQPVLAQTQIELDQQAGAEFHKADGELNALYRDLTHKVSSAGQGKLRAAQQAWLRFRDSECAFETAGSEGGSVHPMVETECRTELTRQRNQQLKAQLSCKEGDLSCGGQ
jgi:uncharacterized protein YecT (DUF1311 family)